jgi:hypothetical protein
VRTHKRANLHKLTVIEWGILRDLGKMLSNPSQSSSTECTQRLVAGITCKEFSYSKMYVVYGNVFLFWEVLLPVT